MTPAKTKWCELETCSPRKYYEGSSYPDKNKGCAKRPQALAIVLMVHAYSPTVIADWNHRMFLVISIPTMWKGTRVWFEVNPPFARLHFFFSLSAKQVFSEYWMYLQTITFPQPRACPVSYHFSVSCHTFFNVSLFVLNSVCVWVCDDKSEISSNRISLFFPSRITGSVCWMALWEKAMDRHDTITIIR